MIQKFKVIQLSQNQQKNEKSFNDQRLKMKDIVKIKKVLIIFYQRWATAVENNLIFQ